MPKLVGLYLFCPFCPGVRAVLLCKDLSPHTPSKRNTWAPTAAPLKYIQPLPEGPQVSPGPCGPLIAAGCCLPILVRRILCMAQLWCLCYAEDLLLPLCNNMR